MTTLSIQDIVFKLPMNTEPNTESIALRVLNDQNRIDEDIFVELVVRGAYPTLRATFHANSNPFTQARIFLTRKLVPLTLADCLTFAKIVCELAQEGERRIICNEAATSMFIKYNIKLNAEPIPKTKTRPPRTGNGNAF